MLRDLIVFCRAYSELEHGFERIRARIPHTFT